MLHYKSLRTMKARHWRDILKCIDYRAIVDHLVFFIFYYIKKISNNNNNPLHAIIAVLYIIYIFMCLYFSFPRIVAAALIFEKIMIFFYFNAFE